MSGRHSNSRRQSRPAIHGHQQDNDAPSRRWARSLLEARPEILPSEVLGKVGIIPDTITDNWAQEDEDFIQAAWDESPEKREVPRINGSRHGTLLKLWRCHVRVLQTSPHRVISPLFNLRYQAHGNNDTTPRGTFSALFCDNLASLIVHPCWQATVERIVWALQYAVICRLDDRRNWPAVSMEVKDSCPALRSLYEELSIMGPLPRSLHSMHISARERVLADGGVPSKHSDILHQIGEKVLARVRRRPRVVPDMLRHMDVDVLPLTGWDVDAVIAAIDSMDFGNPDWQFPASEAYGSFKAEYDSNGGPTMSQLPEIFELTFKGMLREIRLKTRIQAEPDVEMEDDIPLGSDASDPSDGGSSLDAESTVRDLRSPSLGTGHVDQNVTSSIANELENDQVSVQGRVGSLQDVNGLLDRALSAEAEILRLRAMLAEAREDQRNSAAMIEVLTMEKSQQAEEITALKVSRVQDKWKLEASEARIRELENRPETG
ncbi:hypothetical protein BKA59DRAFT_505944 [Fusarium tricinctum]|uniref:Uncharacterized protein n=1 Tax=Fusarium tricinctum TaxID=61284 RepID=A0A8K0S5N2_9HYPO|nr:hypothetical protein BKA59DRAFT_505944 [Fusarium tricinctum]